jgi:hypothetical protein
MASQTDIQEASQALFCALADYSGASNVDKWFNVETYPTYLDFKEQWDKNYKTASVENTFSKQVKSGKATLDEIENLMHGVGINEKSKKHSWYKSSVLIANKMIKDINQISSKFNKIRSPSWSSIFYSHADDDIMKTIADLYKKANDQQKELYILDKSSPKKILRNYDDINKWSTADIYFASDIAKARLIKLKSEKILTFIDLNVLVSELIEKGELLPLSLKKSVNSVVIKKVNFVKKEEDKLIKSLEYSGTNDWKLYRPSSDGGKSEARTLLIYMKPDKKLVIQVRHDPSTVSYKMVIQYTGSTAFEGSLTFNPIVELIHLIDSTFASKWSRTYKEADTQFKERKKFLDKEIKSKDRKRYDIERTMASAMLVTNKVNPMLIDWLNGNQKKADTFVQLLFMYATARSENSSKYVIAKEG